MSGATPIVAALLPLEPSGTVAVENQYAWFPLVAGEPQIVRAEACAHAGIAESLTLWVSGAGSVTETGTDRCLDASHTLTPLAPGWYSAAAEATFDNGSDACDSGFLHFGILPRDPASLEGFPDLAAISEADTVGGTSLELLVTFSGTIRSYRVSSGGLVLSENTGDTIPEPADRFVIIELGRTSAHVSVEGAPLWYGATMRTGTSWWHVDPLVLQDVRGPCPLV